MLLSVAAGRIVGLDDYQGEREVTRVSGSLVPGFIDAQVNGGGGCLFNQHTNVAGLQTMMQAHMAYGTTAMMPTLITDSFAVMEQAAHAIIEARQLHPAIVGVHFEGPWISQAKKGIHSEGFIRPPTEQELTLLTDPRLGKVMVTVAPETVTPEIIRRLARAGVLVFLGHSNAQQAQVEEALAAGAMGFTHLYNAMSAMQSRAPGMVGVALNSNAYAGLIVDGYHVEPSCCAIAFKAKGIERVMLVTDAMGLAATNQTQAVFFDTVIHRHGDKLTTPEGTIAGSCLTMDRAVKNAVTRCGMSLQEAVIMATKTPATMLGLADDIGSIAVGKQANFIALDKDMNMTQLWFQGELKNLGEQP
jgi:N-acetylglucosamine-6-phosphate deacetylase